jgi:hypothetical protein
MLQRYLESSDLLVERLFDGSRTGKTDYNGQLRSDITDQLRTFAQLKIDVHDTCSAEETLGDLHGLLRELEAIMKVNAESSA